MLLLLLRDEEGARRAVLSELTLTMFANQSTDTECVEQTYSCIRGADNRMYEQKGRWDATANVHGQFVHPRPPCSHKPGPHLDRTTVRAVV